MANINLHGSAWHDERQSTAPPHLRRITERVAAKDRDWSRVHPRIDRFARPYVPGEFWPDFPPTGVDVTVHVTQRGTGIGTRQVLGRMLRRPGNRMAGIDPSVGYVLSNVPMEGWSDA